MKMMKWVGLTLIVMLTGCTSDNGYSGVDNAWRSANAPVWEAGMTTETDVIDALGPPSQLIALDKETVYYYMREERRARGLLLLIYNWKNQTLIYDRAIFFFDKKGELTKFSYSLEALPYEETE